MKKLFISLLILLVLLLGGWLGVSWWFGQQAEGYVRDYLQRPIDANQGLTQELVHYERSLLSSTVVSRLKSTNPLLGEWLDDVQFVSTIKHGPVLMGEGGVQFGLLDWDTQLDRDSMDAETKALYEQAFAGQDALKKAHALIGFDRVAHYQMALNPLDRETETGGRLKLTDLNITGAYNAGVKSGSYTFKTGAFEWSDGQSGFSASGIEGNGTHEPDGLETLSMKMPAVSIQTLDSAENITFDTEIEVKGSEQDGFVQGVSRLKLSNLQGIDNGLKRLDLTMDMAGLNRAGLQEVQQLQEKMESLQAQLFGNMAQTEVPEGQQQMGELVTELQATTDQMFKAIFERVLVADRTQLKYDLDMDMNEGTVKSTGDLKFAGSQDALSMESLFMYGPADWGKLLRGTVKLVADKTALPEELQLFLAYPVQAKGIIETANQYSLDLNLQGEQLELNGMSIDLNNIMDYFMLDFDVGAAQSGADIPDDLMQRMEEEGFTPELLQQLEESDDVSEETLQLLKQLQQMSEELPD